MAINPIIELNKRMLNRINVTLFNRSLTGMVSIPVSVYQTVVTSIAQLNDGHPGNVQIAIAPMSNDDPGLGQATIKEMDSESDSEQMVVAAPHYTIKQKNSGNVPDATQAVEVMTVEPDLKVAL